MTGRLRKNRGRGFWDCGERRRDFSDDRILEEAGG